MGDLPMSGIKMQCKSKRYTIDAIRMYVWSCVLRMNLFGFLLDEESRFKTKYESGYFE